MKSGLGIEKYDVCSNKHCSSTMCAIISLKVWIDINCAQTVDSKKQNCILSVSHRFIHILIRFFLPKNPIFYDQKFQFFWENIFFFAKNPIFYDQKFQFFWENIFFFTKNHFEKIFLVFVSNAEGFALNIMLKIRQKKFWKISAVSGQNFLGQT